MATAKLEIACTTHSAEELSSVLADYTSAGLVQWKQLFGGYSGSNYLVELDDGSTFVLKITNGYTTEHASLMCRTAHHLGKLGYTDCCFPVPKSGTNGEFVSTKEQNGVPAFLLTYVKGQQADQVMRNQPHLATKVMNGIGGGLARMHHATSGIGQAEAKKFGLRWYQESGGCCDVQDQINGKVLSTIMLCELENLKADYLQFYGKELMALQSEMKYAINGMLEHGITHGDPFADNVLVDAETGQLSAFIDIEDFCVGPLLFDLACCAIGCCFKEGNGTRHPQVLDMFLLAALLQGYCADRKLPELEMIHFVPFMRLTLLCNCSWRFVKFNVNSVEDVPDEAKNSYLELQRRIEYLHDPQVVQEINKLLERHPYR